MIAGLEVGCRAPLLVRRERIGGGGAAWRLCYASDLHLTRRREFLIERIVAAARDDRPDAVLFGGDLVDRHNGIDVLARLVQELSRCCPVVVVPGNHDAWCGRELVRGAVVDSGGAWLPDAATTMVREGLPTLHLHATPRPRADTGSVRVLVAHHPAAGEEAARCGYDAVFAGHLHGGQCVLWERRGRQYPGALLSRWNGLRFALQRTTMLVSRGVADTLPVRFRCPREVILCELAAVAAGHSQ